MQPEDLTALERRLAGCRPATGGLDADAMLFAAGRATAPRRGSRIVWPAVACGFAFLSLALGAVLMNERSQRLALADRISRLPVANVETPATVVAPSLPLAPDSYIVMRHMMDQNGDAWTARPDNSSGPVPDSAEAPPILHAWTANSADLQP
jgi:hypothetical protein